MTMRTIRALMLFLALAATLSCTKTMDVAQQRSRAAGRSRMPIKILLVWPSAYKDLIEEGVRMGVDQLNAAGGVLGRRVELTVADDNADINEGLVIAERYAENPEFMAVIGHCDSYVSKAVALVYETNSLIMVSPGSTIAELTEKGYRFVFRNVPTDDLVGTKTAELCSKSGYDNMVVCYADTSYGMKLANSFESRARELGVNIIDRTSYSIGDEAEFKGMLSGWGVYKYDAIFFAGQPEAGLSFINRLRFRERSGGEPVHPVVGGDGLDTVGLLGLPRDVGKEVYAISWFNPNSQRAEARRFVTDFEGRWKHLPDAWAALGYDALQIIVEGMRRAKSCDPRKVEPQIHALKDWVGVTGVHSFDQKGDVAEKTVALKSVEDQSFVYRDLE